MFKKFLAKIDLDFTIGMPYMFIIDYIECFFNNINHSLLFGFYLTRAARLRSTVLPLIEEEI